MDKPEDYKSAPRQIREEATLLINSFGHDLSLLEGAIAAAILSAQSQAYIDAARIAEDWVGGAEYISAAILQRKEEIGR